MDNSKFQRYEEDFVNSSRIIGRSMRQLENANGNIDAIIRASVDIESELSEAEGFVKAMEVNCSLIKTEKKALVDKVIDYKDEYMQLVKAYRAAKENAESLALKGGSAARSKLLSANKKLDSTTQVLEQSKSILHEANETGDAILSDMEAQRSKLTGAQQKVQETNQFSYDARYVLRQMGFRAMYQKLCLVATIVVLAVVIILIGYYGIYKKHK